MNRLPASFRGPGARPVGSAAPSTPIVHRTGRSLRIALAGGLTSLAAPGGGETQLLATAQALSSSGACAQMWRPWEAGFEGIDCLHLFGSLPEHLPVVLAARRRGIRIALSTIAWYDLAACWHEPTQLGSRLSRCARFLIRKALPVLPSWRRRLYDAVDLLLPNSQAEAEQLMRYFRVPAQKIRVVPNGADRRFAAPQSASLGDLDRVGKFILYPGRIEPRKNQLGFLQAMFGTNAPIVILGDVVPGQLDYFKACRAAARGVVRFMPRIPHHDPRLEHLYAAAGCVVLASWFETPGLVAIEAAMSGTPIVVPARGSAEEYFGPLARYVDPGDPGQIRSAVLAAYQSPRDPVLAELMQSRFTWEDVARRTYEAYEDLF